MSPERKSHFYDKPKWETLFAVIGFDSHRTGAKKEAKQTNKWECPFYLFNRRTRRMGKKSWAKFFRFNFWVRSPQTNKLLHYLD